VLQFWPPGQVVIGVQPHTFCVPPPPQVLGAVQFPQLSIPPQPLETVPQLSPDGHAVSGVQLHTFGVPPPPHVFGAVHMPQLRMPPQPSLIEPQFAPLAAHVVAQHPSALQVPLHVSGSGPFITVLHAPVPAAHEVHTPLQLAAAQQYPSLQVPDAHWLLVVHTVPAAPLMNEQNDSTMAAGVENDPLAPLQEAPFTVPHVTSTRPTPPTPPAPSPPPAPPAPPVAVSTDAPVVSV
jgi:hypothetical protein